MIGDEVSFRLNALDDGIDGKGEHDSCPSEGKDWVTLLSSLLAAQKVIPEAQVRLLFSVEGACKPNEYGRAFGNFQRMSTRLALPNALHA